jgi:hypothetical protein
METVLRYFRNLFKPNFGTFGTCSIHGTYPARAVVCPVCLHPEEFNPVMCVYCKIHHRGWCPNVGP